MVDPSADACPQTDAGGRPTVGGRNGALDRVAAPWMRPVTRRKDQSQWLDVVVLDARPAVRAQPGRPGRRRFWPDRGRAWPSRLGRDLLAAIASLLGRLHPDGREALPVVGAASVTGTARDELLGLISHELRTPVTTIYGNALLLARTGQVSAAERLMIRDIAEDSERLLALMDNLLLLARIEAGTPPYREPLLLTHQLRAACESIAARRRRHINLAVDGGDDIVVEADRAQLGTLIDNLIANAIVYSPEDQPVEVSLRVVGGEALVAVSDRGIGLGADEADRLVQPYYRRAEARRMISGMGIGLTVSARILAAHGGRLWASSRSGGGATVGFALPLMADPGA